MDLRGPKKSYGGPMWSQGVARNSKGFESSQGALKGIEGVLGGLRGIRGLRGLRGPKGSS